ncbi:hypothetical protein BZA70DRAFT_292147 [Myxozyma melibiosi]|uniref:DUF3844 domain-containing protein n=1 Tax=Myxozyma melibiosi TaxID=54550 RepID=A0ABR1EYF9_9ASCO
MLLQPIAQVAAVAAALLAPLADAAAAHPASVFAFPKTGAANQHDIPSLRPAEARLVFAERLGVSRFHKLGYQGQDMKVLELDRFSGEHTGLWKDKSENVVVIVSGVSNTKDVFVESRPAFFIADTPDADSFSTLANGFIKEAQQLIGDLGVRVFGSSEESFITVVPDMDLCVQGHQESISRSQCAAAADADLTKDFTHVFGEEFGAVFDADSSVDAAFMDEALAMNSFIEGFSQAVRSDNQLAVLFFNGLNSVMLKYGTDSMQYQVGSALFAKLLQKLALETSPSTPITAVLLPGGEKQQVSSKKAKRSLEARAFGDQHSSPALSVGILAEADSYTTQEECEIMTNYCSGGHGYCMEMYGQEGYFGCQCISTYDETTRQRTYWAGDYCQKYDVSVPFNIFFWGLILSLLFVGFMIKAMVSMGAEELPAVLAAATMVQTKA